jgi:NADPH-dependent 2,4-dienoyl-CoA reductase/sulfur reductase-like enzyme
MTDRVVVVGASVAGMSAVRGLRAYGFDGEIVVVTGEQDPPHDKPPLSKQLLAGEWRAEDISLLGKTGVDSHGVDWRRANPATGLDTVRRQVLLADGERLRYGKLIIATGARARELPGVRGPGVHVLRGLSDALALRADLLRGEALVVVGAGFIGAEVAATARRLGVAVTIVEYQPTPFHRVLGATVGALLARLHEDNQVGLLTNVGVDRIERGSRGIGAVRLTNGTRVQAGTVVVGVGVTPNTEWLAGSPLVLDDGVVCDEYCTARGAGDVFAIGDVARWFDVGRGAHCRVEHWTNASEQGDLVARNLVHPRTPRPYASLPYFWSDQHGVKIQMVGRVSPGDHVELVRGGADGDRTAAVYSAGGRVSAALTLGWPRAIAACRRLLSQGAGAREVLATLHRLAAATTAGGGAAAPVPRTDLEPVVHHRGKGESEL